MSRVLSLIALVALAFACASKQPEPVAQAEPEPMMVAEVMPEPEPRYEPVYEPKPMQELPKTASGLPLLGLAGSGALSLAGALRWIRRRL
jgi:LPXTG-motif cell wall-anchored protein